MTGKPRKTPNPKEPTTGPGGDATQQPEQANPDETSVWDDPSQSSGGEPKAESTSGPADATLVQPEDQSAAPAKPTDEKVDGTLVKAVDPTEKPERSHSADDVTLLKAADRTDAPPSVGGSEEASQIDETQALYYPAIMRAIVETGYKGYVAHEFVPKRDPLTSLAEAVKLCDV